jgi:hypothetical protein
VCSSGEIERTVGTTATRLPVVYQRRSPVLLRVYGSSTPSPSTRESPAPPGRPTSKDSTTVTLDRLTRPPRAPQRAALSATVRSGMLLGASRARSDGPEEAPDE